MATVPIIDRLLKSAEPSIRVKVRVHVLGENPTSRPLRALREEIRRSERVAALLGAQHPGMHLSGYGVYAKWQGAHWVFASLADLGYPAGDRALLGIRDRLMAAWLSDAFYAEFEPQGKSQSYRGAGIPKMLGRYRAHASQQASARARVRHKISAKEAGPATRPRPPRCCR